MSCIEALLVTKGHVLEREPFFRMIDALTRPDAETHITWTHVEQPAVEALLDVERAARYDTIVWYDMPGVTFTQGEPPFPQNDRPRPTSRGSCRCSTRASRWSFCTTRSPLGPVGPNMPS